MVSKRVFQLAFLAVSGFFAFRFCTSVGAVVRAGAFAGQYFRLTVLGLRGPADGGMTLPATATQLASFGLLSDGCPLGPEFASNTTHNGTNVVRPPSKSTARINGFYLVTAAEDGSADTVRWVVEASSDEVSWTPVGAPVWRFGSDGTPDFYPDLAANIPSRLQGNGHGGMIMFDMRPSLSWMISTMAEQVLYMIAFLLFPVTALIGKAQYVKSLWIGTVSIDLVLFAAAGITVAVAEPWFWREARTAWGYVVVLGVLASGTAACEERFIAVLVVCLTALLFVAIISESTLYSRGLGSVLFAQMPTLPFIGLIFGLSVYGSRRLALIRARHLVRKDRQHYDAIWARVRAELSATAAISRVQEEVRMIMEDKDPRAIPRHLNIRLNPAAPARRLSVPDAFTRLWRATTRNTYGDRALRVESLDQLFVQVGHAQWSSFSLSIIHLPFKFLKPYLLFSSFSLSLFLSFSLSRSLSLSLPLPLPPYHSLPHPIYIYISFFPLHSLSLSLSLFLSLSL